MTDTEFWDKAEALLRSIETQCDVLSENDDDLDLDVQRVGNMLTVVFANRSQIVVNLQAPLHEVWMASKAAGQHFRYADGVWIDTKTGQSFFAALSEQASHQSGQPLLFS